VPYTDQYADFPLFSFGYLGVQLFFLLSGFVILMTLEKCNGFFHFIIKRWLRLFPAMLICSCLIYATSGVFFERPNGIINIKDLIPGLTFIEPYYISKLIGAVDSIESAFWSLYVEFKFYVISAFIYFFLGGKKLVYILFFLFCAWFGAYIAQDYTANKFIYFLYSIATHLSLKYFGWFAAGSAFYFYTKTQEKSWFLFACFICICSSAAVAIEKSSLDVFFAIVILCLLFGYSIISSRLQLFLSNRFLVFMGYISYPLYLLHENIMIAFTLKFKDLLPDVFLFLLPLLALAIISLTAFIIAKYLERPLKVFIENRFNAIKSIVS
jgi:peptidoglycan/LPS O-acetylase OafA/YrhL